ncbi:MAG: SDR family NAD(P)-dependent oxidoreductase [Gammaproteobacteria bacterium]|nr:SDR family NAD(P)-dependent oxidoreductase [Gammaproteobacteria bacterium]
MDIKNKTILITGAASGLGAATARELSRRGAKTILLDRNIALAKKIAAEINGIAFECDVTSEDSVKQVLSQCADIHAVINCAGVVHGARIVGKNGAMPLDDFSRVIHINLIGTFNMMRLCAEKMTSQNPVNEIGERGVIINTASIAAFEGQLGQVAYAASKGGVASMTLPAARELSKFGIRVMTIAPGVMETPMMAGMTEEIQKALSADIPFPKKLGSPNYFAELAAHIIENSYLNGETIRLDGALRLK